MKAPSVKEGNLHLGLSSQAHTKSQTLGPGFEFPWAPGIEEQDSEQPFDVEVASTLKVLLFLVIHAPKQICNCDMYVIPRGREKCLGTYRVGICAWREPCIGKAASQTRILRKEASEYKQSIIIVREVTSDG